ncbi:hypothetical protein Tco_0232154 [Tanacetum coccineum]
MRIIILCLICFAASCYTLGQSASTLIELFYAGTILPSGEDEAQVCQLQDEGTYWHERKGLARITFVASSMLVASRRSIKIKLRPIPPAAISKSIGGTGAFGGVGVEEVVVGEGVVVTSSSLEMLTNSCLGGIMVNLIFLEGFEEEALVEFMVEFG